MAWVPSRYGCGIHRQAATAPIQPLAWELPCALHGALKKKKSPIWMGRHFFSLETHVVKYPSQRKKSVFSEKVICSISKAVGWEF